MLEEEPAPVAAVAAAGVKSTVAPPANDFEATANKLMKPVPDYPVKDLAHYVWEISNWSSIASQDKVRSPTFKCGGYEWNILLFPRGNNSNNTSISIYMEPHPLVESDDWYVCAQFGLDLWNPAHPESHLPSGSSHRFNKNETDWGFSSLVEVHQLQIANSSNPRISAHLAPILQNNKLNITGYVKVIDDSSTGVLWHNFGDYDSKKAAGYVGLNNQGATCYLNSLLQSYFTTKNFRELVYKIPTSSSNAGKTSVALSLQRIFYMLTTSNEPVGTMELTKSFGWDSSDAFTQHDVQELNRILMDKLEIAMKGSAVENSLNDIFVGKMKSYIKCVNVPYESSRVEDFWDIQLNVKGFRTLQESFRNYIEIEMLDGENKYQAGDEYGYQDAKKGVVFESFPPVLHLQLKRFEYDFMVDDLVKIDDFYEFPDKIDLKPYLDEEVPSSVKSQDWNYKLHGVLVHQGSISNGHYYAMIKPNAEDSTWLRFDDDKVWKVTPTQVFQENYGANELSQAEFARLSRLEQQENLIRRVTSAYMLVYYRESELSTILPSDESAITLTIPQHIPEQIEHEIQERKRIEQSMEEAVYFMNAKFITTKTFNNFSGFDLALDSTVNKLYDDSLAGTLADPLTVKVAKDDPYLSLYKLIGEKLGYLAEDSIVDQQSLASLPFRLVNTMHRNNHTNRADTPIDPSLVGSTIVQAYSKSFNRKYDEMVFFVEEVNKEMRNLNRIKGTYTAVDPADFNFADIVHNIESVGTTVSKENSFVDIDDGSTHILIFIKYFDPIAQEVKGLTHIAVAKHDPIKLIIKDINKFLNFDDSQELELYEELSHSKIEKIDSTLTFEKHELSNGDIITVQTSNVAEIAGDRKFKDVREYYKFLLTRMHILVKPFKAEIDEEDSDFVADENEGSNGATNGVNGEKGTNTSEDDEITTHEIEVAKQISKSFDFWISTLSTYQELAQEIAAKLEPNVHPDYLRIFIVNHQGVRHPLKSHHQLSQIFPKICPVNQVYSFEYEILNIKLKDYENLKAVKVHWLSSLLQYQVFELLVPKKGLVSDLINKLIHKVKIPKKDHKHILVWSGKNKSYNDLIKFDKPIESIDERLDLYVGVFPAEVEILSSHDMIKRFTEEPVSLEDFEDDEFKKQEYLTAKKLSKTLNLIPAFHFYKNSNFHHGVPFILAVYPEETFSETKDRLRKKLGLGIQAFDKIKFALADSQDKGVYIDHENNDLVLFDEVGKSQTNISFALDHPDRTPRRQNPFDKGISIN
ncbi:uncharacterized protein CANTADRAFT_44255 [Suhomyces tanzawaensis NRRL Y-17324]|uniref:ubiquitinyl hydrolase 1 n=1 Tax=Suhomyces tanzawaensis NRRL Y-17324 TaxID=984487 RepID=A0A1E4SSE1_9ASCO|nr:uncharacterized protein CANTADRAFT_44255 [Suhomyces tanzawaensis NRRL Y-17324]ODV82424.1 hypothetical protein CANTADRAFT_44255 [Suhomyces tanzawaensis NRRL Y-17324]